MKILVYLEQFCNHSETFIYNQVVELNKRHQVLVLCHRIVNKKRFPFDNTKEIPISLNPTLKQKLSSRLGIMLDYKSKEMSSEIGNIVNEFSPDLIHCHFGIQALRFIQNCRADVPVLISFHGYDASIRLQKSISYRKAIRKIVRRSRIYCTFVSSSIKQNLEKFNVVPRWSEILYLGVDTEFFKRTNYEKTGEFIFLQISRLTEKKGLRFTLMAFRKLINRNLPFPVRFVIGGHGGMKKELTDLVSSLDLSDYVFFSGQLNAKEVLEHMNRANVYIHHSHTSTHGDMEGLPVSIMEAMSMELPILSTYHSGIPELVKHDLHGLLSAEKDIDQYAKHMEAILEWSYLSENRTRIEEEFSLQKYIGGLENLYYYMLNNGH